MKKGAHQSHLGRQKIVYSGERNLERKIKAHFLGPSQIGGKEKLHNSYNFTLSAELYFLYFDTVYVVKIGILKSQIKVIVTNILCYLYFGWLNMMPNMSSLFGSKMTAIGPFNHLSSQVLLQYAQNENKYDI